MPKHARRVDGLDEAIISLYAEGLMTGEIQAHLAEIYQVDVSRDLIWKVTDKLNDDLEIWRLDRWIAEQFTPFLAFPPRLDAWSIRPTR